MSPLKVARTYLYAGWLGFGIAFFGSKIPRWLDAVFQGQYLPGLSINYVALNKVLEKLLALMLLPYNISIILKLKGHIKGRLISGILNF